MPPLGVGLFRLPLEPGLLRVSRDKIASVQTIVYSVDTRLLQVFGIKKKLITSPTSFKIRDGFRSCCGVEVV